MGLDLELTVDERAQLDSLLVAIGDGSTPRLSLNGLVRGWMEFVRAVERGYDDSVYEYTNDLSVRARLQSVVDGASATLRDKLERLIAPVDARFVAATVPALQLMRSTPAAVPVWWSRVPARPVGELAADLESAERDRNAAPPKSWVAPMQLADVARLRLVVASLAGGLEIEVVGALENVEATALASWIRAYADRLDSQGRGHEVTFFYLLARTVPGEPAGQVTATSGVIEVGFGGEPRGPDDGVPIALGQLLAQLVEALSA
jgi:hypothetical protein